MNTCFLCKVEKQTTSFDLQTCFCNIFWEGDSYPEEIWEHDICKECIKSFYMELKDKLGLPNAYRDWKNQGRITKWDKP